MSECMGQDLRDMEERAGYTGRQPQPSEAVQDWRDELKEYLPDDEFEKYVNYLSFDRSNLHYTADMLRDYICKFIQAQIDKAVKAERERIAGELRKECDRTDLTNPWTFMKKLADSLEGK